jgi:hypothetical protein
MTKRKHWMYKLNAEERNHYMKYIKSKDGLRECVELAKSRNTRLFDQCYECYTIAVKLGWTDLIK